MGQTAETTARGGSSGGNQGREGSGRGEYSPLEIKKAVVGYGRADKAQIQVMVRTLLNLKEEPQPHDAADALAIALCHAFRGSRSRHTQRRWKSL